MSRISRIPYHQNVYDLLQIEPGESPEAASMIAEHEAKHGPLPASVREWYLVPDVVGINYDNMQRLKRTDHNFWRVIGYDCESVSIADVLTAIRGLWRADLSTVVVLRDELDMIRWRVEVHGIADPQVWVQVMADPDDDARWEWKPETVPFSFFLIEWIAARYPAPGCKYPQPTPPLLAHSNGLWFRTPAEPFEPAVIDYLTDQLDEPERTQRPGNVTTYTFRPNGGIIRVTADEPTLGGGLSAWWVHADMPQRLAELGRLIVPFGTLRETLKADTDPAREVLASLQK
ncbi:MAG: hypothetical protein K8U57_36945 [Planctomycetes bacterium]|nr:hypothetical protein [Planctomycetota bacterium]